jgi:hypothetical protein
MLLKPRWYRGVRAAFSGCQKQHSQGFGAEPERQCQPSHPGHMAFQCCKSRVSFPLFCQGKKSSAPLDTALDVTEYLYRLCMAVCRQPATKRPSRCCPLHVPALFCVLSDSELPQCFKDAIALEDCPPHHTELAKVLLAMSKKEVPPSSVHVIVARSLNLKPKPVELFLFSSPWYASFFVQEARAELQRAIDLPGDFPADRVAQDAARNLMAQHFK